MANKRWRTRTKGTKRQRGRKFITGSSTAKLKTKLKPLAPLVTMRRKRTPAQVDREREREQKLIYKAVDYIGKHVKIVHRNLVSNQTKTVRGTIAHVYHDYFTLESGKELTFSRVRSITLNPCPSKKKKRSVPKWLQQKTTGKAQEYFDRSTVRKQIK